MGMFTRTIFDKSEIRNDKNPPIRSKREKFFDKI